MSLLLLLTLKFNHLKQKMSRIYKATSLFEEVKFYYL